MKRDLAEMEHMIDEYLAFARGEGGEGAWRPSLLRPLIEERLRGRGAAGARSSVDRRPRPVGHACGPTPSSGPWPTWSMNAAVHGEHVRVSSPRRPDRRGVRSSSTTTAPASPRTATRRPSSPFNRLDESRNQNDKGVGLGLAIARDVARGLGGERDAADSSPMGGLRAVLRLPG